MAGLSSYVPSFLKQATGFSSTKESDSITFAEISAADISGQWKQLLLLGYERGFQVWDLEALNQPSLLVSKRTVAIATLKAVAADNLSLLLLTHLYHSADFPKSTIRTYCLTSKAYQAPIVCRAEVASLHVSKTAICVLCTNGVMEVLATNTRQKMYEISLLKDDFPGTTVQFALSSLYFAYSLKKPVEADESNPDEGIAGLVTRSLFTLADQSYATVKSYIDTSTATSFPATDGKVVVRHVLTRVGVCEIQAFPCAVAMLRFAGSGHFLMAAAESGQYLHVYRMNPPLSQQRSGALAKYSLLYKLYRGFTQATISDISISSDEHWVSVTSARGTIHVYRIDPLSTSLHYNHQVFTRIKKGWFDSESSPAPRCWIATSQKQVSRDRIKFEEPLLVTEAPILVAVTMGGRYSTHEIATECVELGTLELARDIAFTEVENELRSKKASEDSMRRPKHTPTFTPDAGWLPLALSPQIRCFTTATSLEELILGRLSASPASSPVAQTAHIVHYSSPSLAHSRLLATLQSSIADTQTVAAHVNTEFILGADVPYLDEAAANLD